MTGPITLDATAAQQLRVALEAGRMCWFDFEIASGALALSAEATAVFGVDAAALTSLAAAARYVHPDDLPAVAAAAGRVPDGPTLRDLVFRWRRGDTGAERWIERRGVPTCDAAGAPVAIRGVFIDVTAQHEAESVRHQAAALIAGAQQRELAIALRAQFLASMSHELRTPVATILGFADLLRSGAIAPTSPGHDAALDDITRAGQHLLALIDDVLVAIRVEGAAGPGPVASHDVGDLLDEVLAQLAPVAVDRAVALARQVAPAALAVVTDGARLVQAVAAAARALVHAARPGTSVRLAASIVDAERWRVDLLATDAALPAHAAAWLAGPAPVIGGVRPAGTGLGLAVARALVELLGGHVELGREATAVVLVITLPRA